MVAARMLNFLAQLFGNFRCVGSARAQHHLRLRRHVGEGVYQVSYTLLAGDAADKQHIRHGRVDSVFDQRPGFVGLLVFARSMPL